LTGVGSSITSANTAAAGSTTQLGVMLAGIDGCRSYCGRAGRSAGEALYGYGSRWSITRKPIRASSWHRLGPGDMPLEAKRFRRVAPRLVS
jgi:hypothetical protein